MTKRNKTGGRTKGTPNKATILNRDFIQALIDKQGPKLEQELYSLSGKDYINAVLQFMEFIIPKIQRQQIYVATQTQPRPLEPTITEIYDEETECSSFIITHN